MVLFIIFAIVLLSAAVFVGFVLENEFGILAFGLVPLVVFVLGLWGWYSFGTESTERITVKEKQRIAEENTGTWIVVAADNQTYENTDAWFHGKSDSTNLQNRLETGHTYDCKVNGLRITFLSSYKNLLDCKEVKG